MRIRWAIGLLGLVLIVGMPMSIFAARQEATWRVASVEEMDLVAGPGRTSAYLAPDGERFAYLTGQQLCVYTIAGEEQVCAEVETTVPALYTDSVRWSPDGRYLALAQDFFRTFRDSDIWVMDTASGDLINLTDDGTDRVPLASDAGDEPVPADVNPVWSSDGSRLYFLRYTIQGLSATGDSPPLLMVGSPDSGDVEIISQLFPWQRLSIYALDIPANGSRLVYNNFLPDHREWSGLWTSNLDGRSPRQVLFVDVPAQTPGAVAASPDGRYALTYHGVSFDDFRPEASFVRLVDLDAAEIMLIDENRYVIGGGWGPSGELAYLVSDQLAPENSGLYIAPGPGQPGVQVLEGTLNPTTSMLIQPLIWGANNAMLLTAPPDYTLRLVRLERE